MATSGKSNPIRIKTEFFSAGIEDILDSFKKRIDKDDIKEAKAPIVGYRLRIPTPLIMLFEEFFNKLPENKDIADNLGISNLRMSSPNGTFTKSANFSNLYGEFSYIMFDWNNDVFSLNFSSMLDGRERINYMYISTEKDTNMTGLGFFRMLIQWSLSVSKIKGTPIEFYGFESGWRNLDNIPNKSFEDVYLPDHQMEDIRMYMNVNDKSSKLLRYLFVGIPGTAKTESMLLLTNEATKRGITTIKTTLDIDKTELADFARFVAPSIVLFDDVDTYIGSRDRGFDPVKLRNFLDFLDGVEKLPDNVGMIATTNSSKMLDVAAQRPGRFHKTIYFDSITKDNIRSIIMKALRDEFSQSKSKQMVKIFTNESVVDMLFDAKKTGSYVYNFTKMAYLKWESNGKVMSQITAKFLIDELKAEFDQSNKMKQAKVLSDAFSGVEEKGVGFDSGDAVNYAEKR